jgi:hypothetical protein
MRRVADSNSLRDLQILAAPLIRFLPGGMLTTAMVELADHRPIDGTSHLAASATQGLLMVFGIVARHLLGARHPSRLVKASDNLLGLPTVAVRDVEIWGFRHGLASRPPHAHCAHVHDAM